MKKFYLKIYGCKVNQYYAELVRSSLLNNGYQQSDKPVSLNIVFACSVTSLAEGQSISTVKKLEKTGTVKVGGCLGFPANDGTWILEELGVKKEGYPASRLRARPTVLIQNGCNRFCSYCKVILLRGTPRDRDKKVILEEVNYLEQLGYNEVVLTGISLGCYKPGLSNLLEYLLANTSRVRFRLGSLNPEDIIENYKILKIIENPRICRHLHLSLQSGSEPVLNDMMRNYIPGQVEKVITKIRSIPGITLGMDIICGFPTETDLNFQETVNFLQKIQPSYLHVFPFSYRPGTLAGLLEDRVGKSVRLKRAKQMRGMGKIFREKLFNRNIGKILTVVTESSGKPGIIGTSGNYLKVKILNSPGGIDLKQMVKVEINGIGKNLVTGHIIPK